MSRWRYLILCCGPLAVVTAAWAGARWYRPAGVEAAGPRNLIVSMVGDRGSAGDGSATSAGSATSGRPSSAAGSTTRDGFAPLPVSSDSLARAKIHDPEVSARALAKACDEKAAFWRRTLGDGCHVLARSPFVIAGDLDEAALKQWYEGTIAPAAAAMQAQYFKTAPYEPVTVLLFRDETSYNHYAKELFGDEGISIYGYFKPLQRTLVMNIATGGGTLVHELTHALASFDFPAIPTWLNEGIASLHEQCRFRDGDQGPWIEGLPNWRLPKLAEAIQQGRLRSLESLIGGNDFRGDQQTINYAQARYFCLYLQRKGKLTELYRVMRENQKVDRFGVAAVQSLFPKQSWAEIDAALAAFVKELSEER